MGYADIENGGGQALCQKENIRIGVLPHLVKSPYKTNAVSNVIAEIQSAVGLDVHRAFVDMSYEHSSIVEFSGDFYGTSLNPTFTMPSGVRVLSGTCLFVHSTAGGGSGDNDKVAVEPGKNAG